MRRHHGPAIVSKALPAAPRPRAHTSAFTLIETLVVVSITAILISVLLPALNSARATAKTLECASNMRSVAIEFALFAEGRNDDGRGDSEKLGRNRFWINDFQDSLYGTDEYWDLGGRPQGQVSGDGELMLCPAGAPDLMKRKGFPCGVAAIGPAENVSLAVNMRLYRAVTQFRGRRLLAPAAATHVRSNILHYPYVPLVMDVDGERAARLGHSPFYIAPPLRGEEGPYADGRYWVPSKRHHGKTNVAFVGGHVSSSTDPEKERWDWAYQAEVGR